MAHSSPLSAQNVYKRSGATADLLRRLLPGELQNPEIAIVCGSGLGGLAETINATPKVELPYEEVPGFPVSTGKFR
jgi:purine-nucleoside phosphorylase